LPREQESQRVEGIGAGDEANGSQAVGPTRPVYIYGL
jgi:hypothetical protein